MYMRMGFQMAAKGLFLDRIEMCKDSSNGVWELTFMSYLSLLKLFICPFLGNVLVTFYHQYWHIFTNKFA